MSEFDIITYANGKKIHWV